MFIPFFKRIRKNQILARISAFLWVIILLISFGLSAQQTVKTGIEVLVEQDFKVIEGMRVGLITNATGVNSELVSTIDLLNSAKNVHLVALYGPEHGVRVCRTHPSYAIFQTLMVMASLGNRNPRVHGHAHPPSPSPAPIL